MESKTSRRKVKALLRRERAWELRLAGHTITNIGKVLGVTVGQASLDVSTAYEEYRRHYAETAQQAAVFDLNRLDALIKAHWESAVAGNIDAATLVLKFIVQRERIHGYSRAERSTTEDPVLAAILQRLRTGADAPG